MTVHPASAEYGIWFHRTDVEDRDAMIPARWDVVRDTQLCTRIANDDGVSVSTIEHLMAALAGCGIHNALVEIDGPEVPLLDGSSAEFVAAFLARGLVRLDAPVRAIEVLKPVTVTRGKAQATLEPSDEFRIEFEIEFEDAVIGHQEKSLDMANGAFVHELCDSRTHVACAEARFDSHRGSGWDLTALILLGDRQEFHPAYREVTGGRSQCPGPDLVIWRQLFRPYRNG